jgi:hypothetical protein
MTIMVANNNNNISRAIHNKDIILPNRDIHSRGIIHNNSSSRECIISSSLRGVIMVIQGVGEGRVGEL